MLPFTRGSTQERAGVTTNRRTPPHGRLLQNAGERRRTLSCYFCLETHLFETHLKRKLFWHIFRAGLLPRAGRRPVGPAKIGGFPGPERLLISTRHRVQDPKREALGVSVPCKRNFQVCKFFVLKIGPDSGIFSRRNIGRKNSLRHELPHTRNPGSVLATVRPVHSF